MTDPSSLQKDLDALGLVAVRRLMDVEEFCTVTGYCKSSVMHGLAKFERFLVKGPLRRILFDACKVQRAIEAGDLSAPC